MTIGLDISKWQGQITATTVSTMKTQGVKFCYVKVTQGSSYEDPQWRNSVPLLMAGGILVGPYHFTTTERADLQYGWFGSHIDGIAWDLPPVLDCEAYTPSYRMGDGEHVTRDIVYGLAYPTEATIDSMARWLMVWIGAQPKIAQFIYPVIYTNASSGNIIFKSPSMSRYSLWVANWGATTPLLPNVWKGKKYMMWQDNVVDGRPYGIDGKVDHDVWGDLFPFPGVTPPPPPTDDEIDCALTMPNGSIYKGKLKETT